MTAKVVEGCIGCGLCTDTCPGVFRMGPDNTAEAFNSPAPAEEPAVRQAADQCPVQVILVEE